MLYIAYWQYWVLAPYLLYMSKFQNTSHGLSSLDLVFTLPPKKWSQEHITSHPKWRQTSGILLGRSLKKLKWKKNLVKRKLEYIELSIIIKKKITISFYKFSNFELLHDSSLWVFIVIEGSYDYFTLLSLTNIFIFILCSCYYLFVFVFIKIF